MESTTITVRRFRVAYEPLDLAPLFARRPDAHPERLVRVEGWETTDGDAHVGLDYANGWRLRATVWIDEYGERHLTIVAAPDNADDLPVGIPYPDVTRAALEFLIGDIGHAVIDPDYTDDA